MCDRSKLDIYIVKDLMRLHVDGLFQYVSCPVLVVEALCALPINILTHTIVPIVVTNARCTALHSLRVANDVIVMGRIENFHASGSVVFADHADFLTHRKRANHIGYTLVILWTLVVGPFYPA